MYTSWMFGKRMHLTGERREILLSQLTRLQPSLEEEGSRSSSVIPKLQCLGMKTPNTTRKALPALLIWSRRLVRCVFVGRCGWHREPLGCEGMGHYFPMEQLLCRTRGISGVSNKGYICLTKAKRYSVYRVTQGTHGVHVNCLESRSLWLCRAQL